MKPPRTLETGHGTLDLPVFMPDATRAAVRTLDSEDLEAAGVRCLMVNSLHLANAPGASLIKSQGGVHAFMGWGRPIATDSGGFQALSLSGGKSQSARVSDEGISFRTGASNKKQLITPEKCIQRQIDLGADILFCLDECTHPRQPPAEQRTSVERTVAWALRCRKELERLESAGARLFAVVQGGDDLNLRNECAERLQAIGFDGYGFGGWPVRPDGALTEGAVAMPGYFDAGTLLHGLGIGNPEALRNAHAAGYSMFDCTLPTRDARHQRLYCFSEGGGSTTFNAGAETWARDQRPVEEHCDCLLCRRYSRAYLRHLFQVEEAAAQRLATIHNLRFYTRLMDTLRSGGTE